MTLSTAEKLLKKQGVEKPNDIKLQHLYEECNLTLEYADDMTADAELIIAPNNHGIITVNQNQHLFRQRFSIAHELGHWYCHKHQGMFACDISFHSSASYFERQDSKRKEREADKFAADLLMPNYLLSPLIKQEACINFQIINAIAKMFQTSLVATAIRVAEMDMHPIIVAVYGRGRRRQLFARSNLLHENLWPTEVISTESYASSLSIDGVPSEGPIPAYHWFDAEKFQDYEVNEESIRKNGQTLSILTLEDYRFEAE